MEIEEILNFRWQKLNFYDNKVHRAQSYCPWLSKDQSNSKASLYLYEPCIIHQNHLLSKNSLKSPIYKNFTILAAVYINIHIADSKKVLFCGGGVGWVGWGDWGIYKGLLLICWSKLVFNLSYFCNNWSENYFFWKLSTFPITMVTSKKNWNGTEMNSERTFWWKVISYEIIFMENVFLRT